MTDAGKQIDKQKDGTETELLSFLVGGGQDYSVDIMSVREIRGGGATATSLPHSPPDYVRGVINLRGTVLPIMDLSKRLGMNTEVDSDRNVIIVVAVEERTVGLMVDAVSDILAIPEDEMQPPPEMPADNERNFVSALTIVDGRMIRILDLNAVLPPPQMRKPRDGPVEHKPPLAIAGPPLGEAAFGRLAALAHREAGLAIAPSKAAMVRTRLARRLRALKIGSYEEYTTLVESDAGQAERREMISALTTNVSHFFREDHHFTRLQDEVFPPELRKRLAKGGDRVRFWSAGCSNGQEPYSLAMSFLEGGPLPKNADFRILATDIDPPKVVAFARTGRYHDRMMTGLDDAHRQAYFTPCAQDPTHHIVSQELKSLVVFRELNLLHDWPMGGKFDVIFCRNVVIYFDADTQSRLWHRFAGVLHPDAWMFLGHSERVSEACSDLFRNKGVTAYQRSDHTAAAPMPSCT